MEEEKSRKQNRKPRQSDKKRKGRKGKKRRHVRLRKYKMARPLVVPCQRQNARPGRKGGRRQEDRKYMRESLTPVTIRKLTFKIIACIPVCVDLSTI